MTKGKLVEKIKEIFDEDIESAFFLKLDLEELRILLASLRDLTNREMQGILRIFKRKLNFLRKPMNEESD